MKQYIYDGQDTKITKAFPIRLPKRVLAPDGFHYGGLADRTAKVLKGFGFTPAPAQPDYDAETKRVVWADGAWVVEDLPEPPEPEPRLLTPIEFIGLCQQAGGMTDANLVASKADANLAAMWIKFSLAPSLHKNAPDVQAGIGGLDTLGYLPNGATAVLGAWPQEG